MMRDYQVSQRRACVLIGVDPKTVRRERPPDHADIREEMREIAGLRRRFGYRRVGVMLERKGHIMNHKKLYRLYREEGLSVRRRRGRKRARGNRTPMPVPRRFGTTRHHPVHPVKRRTEKSPSRTPERSTASATRSKKMFGKLKDWRHIHTRYDRCAKPSCPPYALLQPSFYGCDSES